MAEESEKYTLHRAVFENDLQSLSRLLRKNDVGAKDKHGMIIHIIVSNCLELSRL